MLRLALVSGRLGGRFPNAVKRAPDTAGLSLILASSASGPPTSCALSRVESRALLIKLIN
jgi:hypothetical protein